MAKKRSADQREHILKLRLEEIRHKKRVEEAREKAKDVRRQIRKEEMR